MRRNLNSLSVNIELLVDRECLLKETVVDSNIGNSIGIVVLQSVHVLQNSALFL
jgi:hypothetical protein